MARYTHQHPFTNLRLAVCFVAFYGFPFAIINSLSYRSLGINVAAAVLFLVDFILSLVDILATPQPRHLDALLDGIAGLGYLVLFILGIVFVAIGQTNFPAPDAVILVSALHIFACVKNANPRNRVHWARDVSFPGWASRCKCSHSTELA